MRQQLRSHKAVAGGLRRAAAVCCPLEAGLRMAGMFKAEECSTGIIIQEYIENQFEPLYSFSPCYRLGQGVLQILSHLNPKEVTVFFCCSTLTENINAMFQAEEFWNFCKQV